MSNRSNITDQFLRLHRENPTVYRQIVRFSHEARQSRRSGPLSIALVYERLRWEEYLSTTGDPYRLANAHRAFYVRVVMHCEPVLAGAFRTAPSVADELGRRGHPDQLMFENEAACDDGWLDEAAQIVEGGSP
jgi:hypothetical protein